MTRERGLFAVYLKNWRLYVLMPPALAWVRTFAFYGFPGSGLPVAVYCCFSSLS
jgi:hypothetical protein